MVGSREGGTGEGQGRGRQQRRRDRGVVGSREGGAGERWRAERGNTTGWGQRRGNSL